MKKAETVGIDAPRVERWQAVELMTHHLQLAAMYFEAVPEDPAVRKELQRLLKDDDRSLSASLLWFDSIFNYYERLKED